MNDTITTHTTHAFARTLDAALVAELEAVSTIKAHDDDRAYNQRTNTLSLAHVRHCISQTKKHNVLYGNIITLGDMARKLPECKIELRLAIFASGLSECHYSYRGLAVDLVRWAQEQTASPVDSEAIAAESASE